MSKAPTVINEVYMKYSYSALMHFFNSVIVSLLLDKSQYAVNCDLRGALFRIKDLPLKSNDQTILFLEEIISIFEQQQRKET